MKLFKKAKKGFTLVELVVVIAVIAILAAVSVGAYFGVTTSANNSAAQQEAKALHTNLVLIANDPNNDYVSYGTEGITIKADKLNDLGDALEIASGINLKTFDGIADETGKVYPEITWGTQTGDVLSTFTYKSTAGVSVVVDIVTGKGTIA